MEHLGQFSVSTMGETGSVFGQRQHLRQLFLKFTLFFSLIMLGHLLIPKEVAETLVNGAWRYILCFAGGACGL